MATADNLPCEACQKVGRDGELILVDGGENQTRLRCNKCGKTLTLKISLPAFHRLLRKKMAGKKP